MLLGRETPILKGQGVKNIILVLFRVSSLKRCTVEAFAVPFRVLSKQHVIGCNTLF